MKPLIIIVLAFILLIPVDSFSISISEIEEKLLEAQSQEDIENVIKEVVISSEYQEACKSLSDKLSSMPLETQADGEKALPTIQSYQNLQCAYTRNIWGDAPEQYFETRCEGLIVEFEKYNDQHYDLDKEFRRITSVDGLDAGETWLSTSEFWYSRDMAREIKEDYRHKCLPNTEQCDELSIAKSEVGSKWSDFEQNSLEQQFVSIDMQRIQDRITLTCGYQSSLMSYYETQEKYFGKPIPVEAKSELVPEPEPLEEDELVCGKGTILIDYICQVDKIEEKREYKITDDLEIPRIEKVVEIPIEETVDTIIEKPFKKSEIWFYSFFDWLGGLFK